MGFNISQFKAVVDSPRYGGPAKTSLFTVSILPDRLNTNTDISANDLLFFCKTVTLPTIGVNTFEHRPNGFDISQSIPISINTENISCIFMLDSNHRVLSFFHSWMQTIINYSTQGGILSSVDNKLPYEMGYMDDYKCTIIIRHYTSEMDSSKFYEVILGDAYPTRIDPVNLSWEENNTPASFGVNFSYGSLQFSGERIGTPTERFSRGTGILERIATIGSIGQVIRQSSLPRSIQDAVNQYTRVKDTFTAVRNIFR